MFTKLSDQVYLFPAPERSLGGKTDEQHGPDLILVYGWGDGRLKHVAKFADGFRVLFPRSEIIVVLAPMFKALLSSQKQRISCVQPIVHAALRLNSEGHPPANDPSILVHVLSNTGCLYFTATLEAYKNAFGHVMPHSLLVMDSAPGSVDHDINNIGKLANAMAIDAVAKVPLPLQVTKVMCIMTLYFVRAIELAHSRENLLLVSIKMANDEAFETKLAQRLYIYSKEDRLTAWEAVEKHANEAKALGYRVNSSLCEGSGHVGHMRKWPGKYWTMIRKGWQDAVGALAVKARL
ncbi:PaxU [Colletotrichum melonis]|uniref:PaxU n=1 Tax=Colletotrichum melonis TaxID=1209925 RepID=A0AAI9XM77_9PEZI|nr:PaxU [Colletotrichum melonis]